LRHGQRVLQTWYGPWRGGSAIDFEPSRPLLPPRFLPRRSPGDGPDTSHAPLLPAFGEPSLRLRPFDMRTTPQTELLPPAEMGEADRLTIGGGLIDGIGLMRRAGDAVAG